ncbi:MAG: methyltransferase domain-containing protein [Candidatus Polarisedimenticolia bacterium]
MRDGTELIAESMRRALRAALGRVAREGLPRSRQGDVVVLDVGGRGRPWQSLVTEVLAEAGYATRPLMMDPGPSSDLMGVAEAIPVRDGTAGLVLCTQVLEHVDRPDAAVAEMARVLAPSGACLLTTHGTWFYHPDPADYWRWTSAGLKRLFEQAGHRDVQVRPVGGTKLALATLAITALDRAPGGALMNAARRTLVGPANALAGRLFLDRNERESVPGELAINYLVTARRD